MTGWALRVFVLAAIVVAAAGKQGKTVKKQLQAEPEPDVPEVQLSVGWVSGRWMQTRAGRRVAAFTKIPYAQPPVGELRFKPPVAADSWSEPRESPPLEQVPVCVQPEQGHAGAAPPASEDCLFLNVFTPSAVNGSNLPVLVWLHGGAFREGGAALYGPEYLLDRDVVLVTPNYRLGALGFLSTGDAAAAGNWGLKDQQLALRWVRQHAAALGGDPDRVTLLGQSAGAVSAHLHTAARTSSGLFQRAASLGGSALTAGLPLSGAQARRQAAKLAAALGCPEEPSADLVSCLRGKPARELLAHDAAQRGGLCPLVTWAPVVEDFLDEADRARQDDPPFLEQHPVDALTSGLALDVPWLAGMNLNEGGIWAASIQASNQLEAFDSQLDSLAPLCFGFNDTAHPDDLPAIMEELRDFYFGANNITRENLNDLSNMLTDGVVLSSLDEAMRLHAAYSGAPGFLYLLSHRGQRSFTDALDGGASGRGSQGDLGVVHGDELLSLFPLTQLVPAPRGLDDADDRKVSETLVDLLVNFAKTGNPAPMLSSENAHQSVPWKPVESEDLEFLEVAQGGRLLKGAGMLGNRAHFWSALPLSVRNIRNMQSSIPAPRKRDEF